jgi:hypothetical protein
MSSNIGILESVALGLSDMLPQFVFVGGSVVELYAPPSIRTEMQVMTLKILFISWIIGPTSFNKFKHLNPMLKRMFPINFNIFANNNLLCML